MSDINDGGGAFAMIATGPMGDIYSQEGMSLRDWFALGAEDLKDCPFCGRPGVLEVGYGAAGCDYCEIWFTKRESASIRSDTLAIRAWNKRA